MRSGSLPDYISVTLLHINKKILILRKFKAVFALFMLSLKCCQTYRVAPMNLSRTKKFSIKLIFFATGHPIQVNQFTFVLFREIYCQEFKRDTRRGLQAGEARRGLQAGSAPTCNIC